MKKNTYPFERKCDKCGKIFIAQYYHRFRTSEKWYCSWTCYNHRNDKKEKEDTNENNA